MKNLKKVVLAGFASALAFGAVIANNTMSSNVWRVNPADGNPQNIDIACTLVTFNQQCSVQFPSAIETAGGSSIYYTDGTLSTQHPVDRVFLRGS